MSRMRRVNARGSGAVRRLFFAVLCAACASGCGREEAAEAKADPPPHVPESYMRDESFREDLRERRRQRARIVNERADVVAKMQERERLAGGDADRLGRDAEWQSLKARLADLNARYEESRQEQLRHVRERIVPKNQAK